MQLVTYLGILQVGVYRMSDEEIGCSLAVAASSPAYIDYLSEASITSPSLHVVYINTSLETKAYAHELVPTITCTSSNVVQTILQVLFHSQLDTCTLFHPIKYFCLSVLLIQTIMLFIRPLLKYQT